MSLAVIDILWVFLVAVDVLSLHEALEVATPKMVYFSLMAGLAFFSLPLMWWGSRIGFCTAVVFAAISLVSSASSVVSALNALVAQENILTGLVGLVFSLILLVSSAKAYRGRPGRPVLSG